MIGFTWFFIIKPHACPVVSIKVKLLGSGFSSGGEIGLIGSGFGSVFGSGFGTGVGSGVGFGVGCFTP